MTLINRQPRRGSVNSARRREHEASSLSTAERLKHMECARGDDIMRFNWIQKRFRYRVVGGLVKDNRNTAGGLHAISKSPNIALLDLYVAGKRPQRFHSTTAEIVQHADPFAGTKKCYHDM